MSTVIKFKKSSDFESTKKISNQLLSDKEVRRIFQFTDYDILAFKVLDNDVNEYLDFDFKDLNDLDKTKNIYMRVHILSNPNLLPVQREELPEFITNSSTASNSQVSFPSSVTMFPNENLVHELLIKEERCNLDNILQIEYCDLIMEDIGKVGEQIQDKTVVQNSNSKLNKTYKFPLEEISHFPNLCSALDSKSLITGNEDTLLRILYDSIKRQSSNHAISYANVIDSLFLHFPYLAESYGDLNKSKNIWKVKLAKEFEIERRSFIINANSQETRTLGDSRLPSPPKNMEINTSCTSTSSTKSSSSMFNLPFCDAQEELSSPSCKKITTERDLEGKKLTIEVVPATSDASLEMETHLILDDKLENALGGDFQLNTNTTIRKSSRKSVGVKRLQCSPSSKKSQVKQYTTFFIPRSKLEANKKLKIALRMGNIFTKSQVGLMLEAILEELQMKSQCNMVGYRSAATFVFNEYKDHYSNVRGEDASSFIKYFANSLQTKKCNEHRRSKSKDMPVCSKSEISDYFERYGFPNYVPSKQLYMKDYEEKINRLKHINETDHPTMNRLMDETFSIRRQYATSNLHSTNDLICTFPTLFTPNQFLNEMGRLMGHSICDQREKLRQFVDSSLPDEISNLGQSKFKSSLERIRQASKNNRELKLQRNKLMLGEVALLVHEDPSFIYGYELSEIPSAYPYILMNEENFDCSLVLNNNVLIKDIEYFDMAMIWSASFMNLNIEVPTNVQKTYLFLIMALFGWEPPKTKRIPACVHSLLNIFDKS